MDRRRDGKYGCHNTPGDGTGMTKLPEMQSHEILTDAKGGPDAGHAPPIKYESRNTPLSGKE